MRDRMRLTKLGNKMLNKILEWTDVMPMILDSCRDGSLVVVRMVF